MKSKVIVILSMLALLTNVAIAQNSEKKFSFELNGGASFPVKKIEDTKLNTGGGFEALFHYRFMPHLGVYAGWGWNKLSADNAFAEDDICFEETGYVFGLQFMHPIGELPFSYYVRGAGLYNHIEMENADGDITLDTKHGLGFQLAGGLNFDLGKNWSLNPGIKFNSIKRKTDFNNSKVTIDYKYVAVRVGIVKAF